MKLNEIKSLIGGGFKRDVPTVRQAWIEYGKLLLACPHKQGAKIGQWVREQGLDFVEDNKDRAAAKTLATLAPTLMLSDCPCSTPREILQWLRNQRKQEQAAQAEPQADNNERPERETVDAETERLKREYHNARIALKAAASALMTRGIQRGVTSAEGFKSGTSDVQVSPFGINWLAAVKPKPTQTWGEIGPNGYVGKAQGYAIRIVIDRIEAEVYRDGADGAGPRVIRIIDQQGGE